MFCPSCKEELTKVDEIRAIIDSVTLDEDGNEEEREEGPDDDQAPESTCGHCGYGLDLERMREEWKTSKQKD
jgi:hypothetical protein